MSPGNRVLAMLLLVAAGGCGTGALPINYPSRPPAGAAPAQAADDERACLAVAASAKRERAWAYIGCLVSKGHTVRIAFRAGGEETYVGVAQKRPHAPDEIVTQLEECRRTAYRTYRAGATAHEERVREMHGAFGSCVEPLGYGAVPPPPPAR